MHIGLFDIKNNNCEKLLVIKLDSRLNFNEHLDGIIKKASRKVNELSRITPFMDISKRRILMRPFKNDVPGVGGLGHLKLVQKPT